MHREKLYTSTLAQIGNIVDDSVSQQINLLNVLAHLKEQLGFFWIGFYMVKTPNQLELSFFQGPMACTLIEKGKGVCGTAFEKQHTIIVDDVHKFKGHITCNAASKSEIVLPVFQHDKCIGVLDVDSDQYNYFSEVDQQYLEQIIEQLISLNLVK